MRDDFVSAAKQFLDCEMLVPAAKCLYNAKEILLAAQVYEKAGQVNGLMIMQVAC